MADINNADGGRTFDLEAIPDDMTFTKTEWDVVMAGRAARLIAAGEMPSLEEFLTAMKAVKGAR